MAALDPVAGTDPDAAGLEVRVEHESAVVERDHDVVTGGGLDVERRQRLGRNVLRHAIAGLDDPPPAHRDGLGAEQEVALVLRRVAREGRQTIDAHEVDREPLREEQAAVQREQRAPVRAVAAAVEVEQAVAVQRGPDRARAVVDHRDRGRGQGGRRVALPEREPRDEAIRQGAAEREREIEERHRDPARREAVWRCPCAGCDGQDARERRVAIGRQRRAPVGVDHVDPDELDAGVARVLHHELEQEVASVVGGERRTGRRDADDGERAGRGLRGLMPGDRARQRGGLGETGVGGDAAGGAARGEQDGGQPAGALARTENKTVHGRPFVNGRSAAIEIDAARSRAGAGRAALRTGRRARARSRRPPGPARTWRCRRGWARDPTAGWCARSGSR